MSVLDKLQDMMPARVVLALMTSLGVVMIYMVRINLSMGIIAMVHTVSTLDEAAHHTRTIPYCLQHLEAGDTDAHANISYTNAEGNSIYNGSIATPTPNVVAYSNDYNLTMEQVCRPLLFNYVQ
ncbi:uncharacterized protein LOC122242818 [Penaeus japonicus]|uniref:uncharacterized protein LOC122242818 n=1 Tax=Penaeus japonicus TaxID=27405 RepID=UPI001C715703|nr:uncharacterized protein LOC122242818 [Penaeus japonicus]